MSATTIVASDVATQLDEQRSAGDLLAAVGRNDASAWAELLRRYDGLVRATIRKFRLQEADAFDALQSTWMRLVEHHHRVRDPELLGGWLATTARRECLRILRNGRRCQCTDAVSDTADPSADPASQVVDNVTVRRLRTLMAELNPRQQVLLGALFGDDPPPYAELARIAGIPAGSIGPTRMRSISLLRRKFWGAGTDETRD